MAWAKGGGGGGKGKGGKGNPWDPASDGMLWNAIVEAVATMIHLEKEWDAPKLEKKLSEYFKKGPKNMSFKNTGLEDLINEYADNVMASIFAGLGDREWLYSGKVDFLLILDAGIKDSFPGVMLRNVAQSDFEQMVLGAYERAFDEQRFCPLLTDAVTSAVQGPKAKKKVWNAIDESRKETVTAGHTEVTDFLTTWINHAVRHLSAASQGSPEATYEPPAMAQLFQTLLESGALPTAMAQAEQAPLHLVEPTVDAAYLEHTVAEDADWTPAPKKMKTTSLGAGYGADPLATAVAWGKGAGAADAYGPPADAWGGGCAGGKDAYGPPAGGKAAYGGYGGKDAYGPPAAAYGKGATYGKAAGGDAYGKGGGDPWAVADGKGGGDPWAVADGKGGGDTWAVADGKGGGDPWAVADGGGKGGGDPWGGADAGWGASGKGAWGGGKGW